MTLLEPTSPALDLPLAVGLRRHGDRTAVVTHDRVPVSYAELADRTDEVVLRLGTTRRLVAVRLGRDLGSVVAYLGALRGGHVVLVRDPDPVACSSVSDPYDPDVVLSGTGDDWLLDERRPGTAHDLHPELALLLSTSGSTGAAKLVRLSAANLQANAEAIADYLAITSDDLAATSLPLHYCYGLSVLHSHLVRGAGVLLTERSVVEPAFWDDIRRHRVTSFAGVPHTFELLERVGFADLDAPSLRYITQAGGRLDPATVRTYAELGQRRGWDFFVMYGQTEATARMAYLPPALATVRPDAIGLSVPGGSLTVDAPSGEDVGELVYRGPNVMLGYAEGPADLGLGRMVHELRTGDRGRRGPDGLFEVVGRMRRFVKLFGLRVDLDEIERHLGASGIEAMCTGTDERLVIGLTEPDACNQVVADTAGLCGIPPFAVQVCVVDTLPRLPTGKLDHAGLSARAEAERGPRTAPDATVADGSAHSEIATVFAAVLGGPVDRTDTFVRLGGDSLSYVELSLALEERLGALPAGWPTMTVGALDAISPRPSRWRRIETGVLLRAAAVMAVVASHIGVATILGGAHMLLAAAGYNFARFRLDDGETSRRVRSWLTPVARIAVPTMLYVGALHVFTGGHTWANVFLLNNYLPDGRWRYWYWFVEVLVHVSIVAGLAFSVPAVRRLERRHPLALPVALYAAAVTARSISIGDPANQIYRTHAVVWLFVLGWVVQRAATVRQKLAVTALTVATAPGFFPQEQRTIIVTAGVLLVLWVPQVRLPAPLHRAVGVVAAASLYIYLTHWRVFGWFREHDHGPAVQLAASLGFGIAAWLAVRLVTRQGPKVWRAHVGTGIERARVLGPPDHPTATLARHGRSIYARRP